MAGQNFQGNGAIDVLDAAGVVLWSTVEVASTLFGDIDEAVNGWLNVCDVAPGVVSAYSFSPDLTTATGGSPTIGTMVTRCGIDSHPTNAMEVLVWSDTEVLRSAGSTTLATTSMEDLDLQDWSILDAGFFPNGDVGLLVGGFSSKQRLIRLNQDFETCSTCGNGACEDWEGEVSCSLDCP